MVETVLAARVGEDVHVSARLKPEGQAGCGARLVSSTRLSASNGVGVGVQWVSRRRALYGRLVKGLSSKPDPVVGVLHRLRLLLQGKGGLVLVLGGVHETGGHEDGDGNTKDAQKDVHPYFQRGRGVVVEIMLLVVNIRRGVLWVEMTLPALTVVVPQGNVGENLTEIAHVDTFHSPLPPTVALPRLLLAFVDAPLVPVAGQTFPLRDEVNGDTGSSCGQRWVVLLVTIVRQFKAQL